MNTRRGLSRYVYSLFRYTRAFVRRCQRPNGVYRVIQPDDGKTGSVKKFQLKTFVFSRAQFFHAPYDLLVPVRVSPLPPRL